MPITLKDVARRAGVSRSAVSRTFTPGASVSAGTRAKVEAAARELGYTPSVLASALSTGRTRLIGLVANNFHNPVFLEVFDLFTRLLQDRGLRPLLVNLTDETDPAGSVRLLSQYSVDAVIVASSTLPPGFARAFRDGGLPVVHAFGRSSAAPEVPVVGIDNAECGRLAARTFLARGYRRVAFLGGPEHATSTRDRLAGFAAELAAHPAARMTVSFAADYTFGAGRAEMQRLLAAQDRAEAYFCGDDVIAVGALSAVRDRGLGVPAEVGLLGLNDMEMAGWANIDLTTIRQPIADIIAAAVEAAVAAIDDPARTPEARLFPCRIVERGTLRPLPQDRRGQGPEAIPPTGVPDSSTCGDRR
jgi:DNA-binding LacI/PurR family transcriptional regulator